MKGMVLLLLWPVQHSLYCYRVPIITSTSGILVDMFILLVETCVQTWAWYKVAWASPWKCSSSYKWICHHSCRGYIYNQYVCICVCVYMPTYGALLTIVISTYIHLCSHLSCPSSRHFPRCPRGFTRSKPAGRRIAPRHVPFSWVGSRQVLPASRGSWLENPLINRGNTL